ncbi:MAG: aldo/keto reductase [Streptosporangiales bacterium]|nr:aldo/keto reductase [Streptosporangiales bacterium]
MEQRRLGATGPMVSRFALGAMMFGGAADEKASREMLDTYMGAGGTFIDTADNYNQGTSERWIGQWVKDRPGVRDRVVLATKGRFMVDGQPGASLSPAYLRTALEASLRRLDVDHVDLYQLHGPDADHPLEDVVEFLAAAAGAGQIGYVGVSNFPGWQVAKLARLLAEHGGPPLVSHQIQYSLLVREVEWEILPAAIDAGVGTTCWGALGQGYLTGKYHRDRRPAAGTRVGESPDDVLEAWTRRNTDEVWAIVDGLREVAEGHGVTPAQAALAWVSDRPGIGAPIVGARHAGQLRETLPAADLHLDDSARARLDELTAPRAADYPYPFLAQISHWHN